MLDIQMDARAVTELLTKLPGRIPRATSKALNLAEDDTKAFMAREMGAMTGISQRFVRTRLTTVKSTAERLEAETNATTKKAAYLIPILQLRAREVGKGPNIPGGVTFRFDGQSKTIPNAFIRTMRSKHRGVFTRTGKARLPIIEEKGPAWRTVFELREEAGKAFAEKALATRMEEQLAAELAALARVSGG